MIWEVSSSIWIVSHGVSRGVALSPPICGVRARYCIVDWGAVQVSPGDCNVVSCRVSPRLCTSCSGVVCRSGEFWACFEQSWVTHLGYFAGGVDSGWSVGEAAGRLSFRS